jgi:hypothetical protein
MSFSIKDTTESFTEKDIINTLPRLWTQAASQVSRPRISSSEICFVRTSGRGTWGHSKEKSCVVMTRLHQ